MDTAKKIIAAQQLKLDDSCTDPGSLINRIFDVRSYRDRFNLLNDLLPFNYSDKTDVYVPKSSTRLIFTELADQRANEIIKQYPNGQIVISWSGGVDSTCVLVSFLRNLQDLSRLTVVAAESSLEEYPWMYRHLTNDRNVNVIITKDLFTTLGQIPNAAILLNGFCGDQMYGANIHQYYPNLYNKHWTTAAKTILEDKNIPYTNEQFDRMVNAFEYYGSSLDYPITYWCELCWVFSFGFKWGFYRHEHQIRITSLGYPINGSKATAFYDTPYFEQLSRQNSENVTEYNPFAVKRYYKFPMKQYIYEYTDDLNYYNNKGKFGGRICTNERLFPIGVLFEDGTMKIHEPNLSMIHKLINENKMGYIIWSQQIADLYKKHM